ncbi:hypothetical protein GGR51DRAFT_560252 [Nemania sp. FL0031]|nr:hypothetical protein GGR51DRAFT_560252 [Nemania sp. FL0031]
MISEPHLVPVAVRLVNGLEAETLSQTERSQLCAAVRVLNKISWQEFLQAETDLSAGGVKTRAPRPAPSLPVPPISSSETSSLKCARCKGFSKACIRPRLTVIPSSLSHRAYDASGYMVPGMLLDGRRQYSTGALKSRGANLARLISAAAAVGSAPSEAVKDAHEKAVARASQAKKNEANMSAAAQEKLAISAAGLTEVNALKAASDGDDDDFVVKFLLGGPRIGGRRAAGPPAVVSLSLALRERLFPERHLGLDFLQLHAILRPPVRQRDRIAIVGWLAWLDGWSYRITRTTGDHQKRGPARVSHGQDCQDGQQGR